jgi:HK97 gp10 family phage protein
LKQTKTIIEWNDKEFDAALKLDMTTRMSIASVELEKLVKVSFPDSGIKNATAQDRADNRSGPGEIPHVDTGRLRASISSNWTYSGKETGKVGSKAKVEGVGNPGGSYPLIKGVVGSNLDYAPSLELGNSKMDAHPFLRPALASAEAMIKRIFGVK